ncbi:MAG: type II secretion system protein [Pseudomonadota bacterium]
MRGKQNGASGFTLLELLVSVTIVAVIVTLVMGALRVGIQAWEKGERQVETSQRVRSVLDMFSRQISSIHVKKLTNAAEMPFCIRGTHKTIEFLSDVSMLPDLQYSAVYAKYVVEEKADMEESLKFVNRPSLLLDFKEGEEELDIASFVELIPSAHLISFDYLKSLSPEGDFQWQEAWEPTIDQGVPLAIRLTVRENINTPPLKLIARIIPAIDSSR